MRFFWQCEEKNVTLHPKMKKKIFILVFAWVALGVLVAQEAPQRPDLQTNARVDFFDPGHKEVKDDYRFHVEYRLEAGYVQNNHRSENKSYENLFMHGFRVGGTFDFMLPKRFSIQTGVLYTFTYGKASQNWGLMDWEDFTSPDPVTGEVHSAIVGHRLYEHQLTIPVRMYYNIHLWKDLNLFFYTGPQLHVGLAMNDKVHADLSTKTRQWMDEIGQPYESRDRYKENELNRCMVQWGLGGGMEWDRYRLQAGYDFGLNNAVKHKVFSDQKMWEWHWFVSFCYRINSK